MAHASKVMPIDKKATTDDSPRVYHTAANATEAHCEAHVLLSSTYFGPVQWYGKLAHFPVVLIDAHEHFVKQTYRNRCIIPTTGGRQVLTVPTERANGSKQLMSEVRISDHGDWRRIHWNALTSAYGESPFFDYYADDLRPFFEKRWTFLYDFNMEITLKMCELLDISPCILPTHDYQATPDAPDLRHVIDPKHPLPDPDFSPRRYYQVYEQKHGFLPNMSILDLLMNEGNEAILYL